MPTAAGPPPSTALRGHFAGHFASHRFLVHKEPPFLWGPATWAGAVSGSFTVLESCPLPSSWVTPTAPDTRLREVALTLEWNSVGCGHVSPVSSSTPQKLARETLMAAAGDPFLSGLSAKLEPGLRMSPYPDRQTDVGGEWGGTGIRGKKEEREGGGPCPTREVAPPCPTDSRSDGVSAWQAALPPVPPAGIGAETLPSRCKQAQPRPQAVATSTCVSARASHVHVCLGKCLPHAGCVPGAVSSWGHNGDGDLQAQAPGSAPGWLTSVTLSVKWHPPQPPSHHSVDFSMSMRGGFLLDSHRWAWPGMRAHPQPPSVPELRALLGRLRFRFRTSRLPSPGRGLWEQD